MRSDQTQEDHNSNNGYGHEDERTLRPTASETDQAPVTSHRHENAEASPAAGTETVLLVEDEPGVREFVSRVLELNGYRVLQASTGPEALEVAKEGETPVDVVITDLIMPEMNGTQFALEFAKIRGKVPVLVISGYTADALSGVDAPNAFLRKPFTPAMLLNTLRKLLDESKTQ